MLRGEVMVQIEKSVVHDVRVESIKPLDPPSEYWKRYPLSDPIREQVARHRHQIENILSGRDTRLLIIVGPCSIHDTELGLDYARRLAGLAKEVEDRLMIAMRVYFEKPRTTVGWKGLINDPQLNGTYDVQERPGQGPAVSDRRLLPGAADRDRVPGAVHSSVSQRHDLLGRDRRKDYREPASQAHGKRPQYADRVQERYRRGRGNRS